MKTGDFEVAQKVFKDPLPNLLMLDALLDLGFNAATIGGFVHYLSVSSLRTVHRLAAYL